MQLTWNMKTARRVYDLAWRLVIPALSRNPRLREGYGQRRLDDPLPAADVWIQAASVGEAYLALELVNCLPRDVRTLVTTNTSQGMEVLRQGLARNGHELTEAAYFPFDRPALMEKALEQADPKAVVLLESELWPGLLMACRRADVPCLVVNGRMRTESLAHYLAWQALWRRIRPVESWGVSDADAMRLAILFGRSNSGVMHNIKFDRVHLGRLADYQENPLSGIIRENSPFVVLGSVRRVEEEDVSWVIADILEARPRTVVGLFPRHAKRLHSWRLILDGLGIKWVLRSDVDKPVAGRVILWDTFGELDAAYQLARTCFVGGSLRPLGGQNFLEPLGAGLVPAIGPYWDNFAWVGSQIVESGLVRQVQDAAELSQALLQGLESPRPRQEVLEEAAEFISRRQGGAAHACERIKARLGGRATEGPAGS